MRLRALSLLLLAAALLFSGCDSDGDGPTTTQAEKNVSAWMDEVETALTDGLEPLSAWQTTDDGSKDRKSGCDDGKARRTYAATVDVPAQGDPPDPDNAEALVWGQLIDVGWDPSASNDDEDAVTGAVSAKRTNADTTGTKLSVDYSPVDGGWHYVVTARTACLPTE